jgi:hypothetical protein
MNPQLHSAFYQGIVMENEYLIDAVAIPSVLAFVGWMFYLLYRRYQASSQVRLQKIDSFNKLIEKFGNGKEFLEFAQTEQGKKLLGDPILPPPNPLSKVLRLLQAGIVFLAVGIASWINAARLSTITDPLYVNPRIQANDYGTLAAFLGMGLIVAAGISYIFVRRWHLANGSSTK